MTDVDLPVATARELRDAGQSVDAILTRLRADGVTMIGCIRTLVETHGLSLAAGKMVVHNSPAWADQRAANDALHADLVRGLSEPDDFTAFAAIYGLISDTVSHLGQADLLRNSRCTGWTVGDVLYHQLLDARRALVTFASPADAEPDVDEISYWRAFEPGGDEEHARHVRIVASTYPDGALGREWRDTATAAVWAARVNVYDAVTTQGHVLRARDFIATLVFEATIHYLDMTVDLPGSPEPNLGPVRRILDGLLGATTDWDDRTYALKGTGRAPLTEADRAALGELAERFPLTG